MGRTWRVVVFLAVMALCSTGCELAIGEADAPEPTPLPVPSTAQTPVPGPAAVGVERNVAPLAGPTNPEADPGLELVAITSRAEGSFALDGAAVGAAFDARLVIDDDRAVDRVVWRIGGVTFRDDDVRAPYTLRYGSRSFPLDKMVRSDQGLPGRFKAARGATVELTATVFSDGDRDDVTAVFGIGVAPTIVTVVSTTTTRPPAPTTTVRPPAPTTTTVRPPTPTTTARPPTPSGDVPWSIASGTDVAVTLPQGRLGPRTATPVDPATVSGISYAGGVWSMGRDWDETRDGGYLEFGAAAVRTNGHRVLGFRLAVPPNVAGDQLIDGGGEVGWFELSNPGRYSHNSFIRHTMHAHHYIARGVVGDAIKVGEGSAYHHDAFIEMAVIAGGSTDKHYDGVQVFNQGTLRLERVVIEWNDAGVIANTTGALFTQDAATLFARDVLVLNPGGTWQPVRLSGTGAHDVDRVQLIGRTRPNNNSPGKLAPTAAVKLTNGSGTFQLWNGVAGAADWLIE